MNQIKICYKSLSDKFPEWKEKCYILEYFFSKHPIQMEQKLFKNIEEFHNTPNYGKKFPRLTVIPKGLASSIIDPIFRTDIKDNELNIDINIRELSQIKNRKKIIKDKALHKIPRIVAEEGFILEYWKNDKKIHSEQHKSEKIKEIFLEANKKYTEK